MLTFHLHVFTFVEKNMLQFIHFSSHITLLANHVRVRVKTQNVIENYRTSEFKGSNIKFLRSTL